eukprot:1604484-Alexandrium_andersonii.AAC.1
MQGSQDAPAPAGHSPLHAPPAGAPCDHGAPKQVNKQAAQDDGAALGDLHHQRRASSTSTARPCSPR